MSQPEAFGSALRQRRLEAGLSLDALAKALHYSKGQLSKVENNLSRPSTQLARLADAILGAGGELVTLAAEQFPLPPRQDTTTTTTTTTTADTEPVLPSVRRADAEDAAEDELTGLEWRRQFDLLRTMGRHTAPGMVIPLVTASLRPLRQMLSAARRHNTRARLGLLTARYAEYLGWMMQEAGRDDQALRWTRHAAVIGAEAGDRSLTAYSLVREAELALYEHDGKRVIALASRGMADTHADLRVKGLAAHRLAQGFALRGDEYRCRATLDEAGEWLEKSAVDGSSGPVLGSTTVADLNAAVAGWCLYDLGRPAEAARLLERTLAGTSAESRRARALYGARLALAHEAAGEVDRMCEVAEQALAAAGPIDSATVRAQLKALAGIVVRRHGHPPAKRLHAKLTAALYRGAPADEFPLREEP